MLAKKSTKKGNIENYENENFEGENYEVTVYLGAVHKRRHQLKGEDRRGAGLPKDDLT